MSACDLSGTSDIIFLPLGDGRLTCWGLPGDRTLRQVKHRQPLQGSLAFQKLAFIMIQMLF